MESEFPDIPKQSEMSDVPAGCYKTSTFNDPFSESHCVSIYSILHFNCHCLFENKYTLHYINLLFSTALAYDYMGTYEIAFYAAGVPPIFAAILMFLIPKKRKQQQQPEQVRRYCEHISQI